MARPIARQFPAFKLGQKLVFLPDHVITFIRREYLPPHEALFKVPLTFSKFDLRDYLWNLYNVETTKVRAFVKALPLALKRGTRNRVHKPKPEKYMIVDLVKPFSWPEVPKDKTAWHNDLWMKREKAHERQREEHMNKRLGRIPLVSAKKRSLERQQLAHLAKDLLLGKIKWSNNKILDPKWDEVVSKTAQLPQDRTNKAVTQP